MQDKNLFEYAVLRVVPRVEREEFLNVGVVLFCRQQKFLKVCVAVDEQRIAAFSPGINMPLLCDYLSAFSQICLGAADAGPIGRLPLAERFRWLTAPRSTILQTSRVHTGFCRDGEEELNKLFERLVLIGQ